MVDELEYHYSDGAFGDGLHANITIRYYRKMDLFAKYRFAKYRFAYISNFTVLICLKDHDSIYAEHPAKRHISIKEKLHRIQIQLPDKLFHHDL